MIRLGRWFDVALAIAHVTVTTVALSFVLSIWVATIVAAGVTGLVVGGLWLWSWRQQRAERLARERYQEWRRKDAIFYLNPGATLR